MNCWYTLLHEWFWKSFCWQKADTKRMPAPWFHLDKILENITIATKSRSAVACGWGEQGAVGRIK